MDHILIIKCGAAGDVVRTTTLLHLFQNCEIDWLVSKENRTLLPSSRLRAIYDDPAELPDTVYDLVINLEDDHEFVSRAMRRIRSREIFGAYCAPRDGRLFYTDSAAAWFDMGLISRYGLEHANHLKYENHRSYQEIIFEGLGYPFRGEPYIIPESLPSSTLEGEIAVAPTAGKRWPMKNWAYTERLIDELSHSYRVNVLPVRRTMLEHVADIGNHRLVIAPDSLPMHLALGLGKPCLTVFPCTSPWEIYDYRLLKKIVSPKLRQYFFGKTFVEEAVTCIAYETVRSEVEGLLLEHKITPVLPAQEVRMERVEER